MPDTGGSPLGSNLESLATTPPDFLSWDRPYGRDFSDSSVGSPLGTGRVRLPEIPGVEVIRLLGRGGMGRVYLGRQTEPDRLVAIKTLTDDRADDDKLIARLRGEARALDAVKHPNIVRFYDVLEVDGRPVLMLEYVDGGNLADYAKLQSLSVEEVCRLVELIGRGIGAAHQVGITHRDLKPANVLMDGTTPRITDFGLALNNAVTERLTSTGDLFGTPEYMAPELFKQGVQSGSRASDIYALGVILYELLTGSPPFEGNNLYQIMQMATSQAPRPPEELNPDIPERISAICQKALAKTPEERFATAEEFADALSGLYSTSAFRSHVKTRPKTRATNGHLKLRRTLILITVLLVSAVGLERLVRSWPGGELTVAETASNTETELNPESWMPGSLWQGYFAFLPAPEDRKDGDFELEIESREGSRFQGIYYSENRQYAWRVDGEFEGNQFSWTFPSAIADNAAGSVVGRTVVTGSIQGENLTALWEQETDPPTKARLTGRLVKQKTEQ